MERITEIHLNPTDIKVRNEKFLNEEKHHYDVIHTKLSTRKSIQKTSEKNLQRVIDEFPYNEDLTNQCGLWIHAIVGKHFFPDANHRTAISTLRSILDHNNIELWDIKPEEIEKTTPKSKTKRQKLSISIDKIYQKDELFKVWKEYFKKYY